MIIKLKIREIAEAKGINPTQLSRKANISHTSIYRLWENEGNPSLETLAAIAEALGVNLKDLFEEIKETHSKQ